MIGLTFAASLWAVGFARAQTTRPFAIAIHGGAGTITRETMTAEKEPRQVRITALALLAHWPDKRRGIAVATRYLDDGDPLFASAAAATLGSIGGEAGQATLRRAAQSESRVTVKAAIAEALSGEQ